MTTEFWQKPDYIATFGSKMYGTSTASSDNDERGFVLEPLEFTLGLGNFEQYETPKPADKVIYGLRKFFKLLLGGNINALEILYAPDYKANEIGELVRNNRIMFHSKKFYSSIRGFAQAEIRKAAGLKLVFEAKEDGVEKALHNFVSTFRLQGFQRDEILDLIFKDNPECDPRKLVKNEEVGEKRGNSIAEFGYGVKNACHAIRLLHEGIELLNYGNLTFPRPEAVLLRDIRAGKFKYEEVKKLFDGLDSELVRAMDNSLLPKLADFARINDFYLKIAVNENLILS